MEGEILTIFFKSTSSPARNIKYKNPSFEAKSKIAWSTINAKYPARAPSIISTVIDGSLSVLATSGEIKIINDIDIIISISSLIQKPTSRLPF